MPKTINLYWVSTEDSSEDWFIFADTERGARKYHSDYEGFDTIRGITAELVVKDVKLSEFKQHAPPTHAQLPALKQLGFTILSPDPNQRVVRLGDRTFVEGVFESVIAGGHDDVAESRGWGRPRGTPRRSREN